MRKVIILNFFFFCWIFSKIKIKIKLFLWWIFFFLKNFNFLLQDLTSKLNLGRFLFCKAFQAKKLKFDKLFKRRRSIWIFFFSLQASDVLNGKCINVIETRKYPITSRAYYTSSIPYKNREFYTTFTAIALWLQLSCQLAYLLKCVHSS